MAKDKKDHDVLNAFLYLETFPEILSQTLESILQNDGHLKSELNEMMEIYVEKLNTVKENCGVKSP